MALLQQLRPNLLSLPEGEGIVLFSEYYHKREGEIIEIPTMRERKVREKKEAPVKRNKQLTLTSEQLTVLKQLGLL